MLNIVTQLFKVLDEITLEKKGQGSQHMQMKCKFCVFVILFF